jgi:hypothetical protein
MMSPAKCWDSDALKKDHDSFEASPLHMDIDDFDGGEYSEEYCVTNLLQNDPSCYCSEKEEGINIVTKFAGGRSFTLTHVEIRAPQEGFTSPLGQGLIFVSWGKPDLRASTKFDNFHDVDDYHRYLKQRTAQKLPLDETDPVAFFEMRDTFDLDVKLDVPRSGRYVHVKLLRPRNRGANVDVQYIGFHGWTGPRAFALGELQ